MPEALIVEFVDEQFSVPVDDVLTFGRRAGLVVDPDNQFMHRIVGSFLRHQDSWWLRNDGTTIELTVAAETGRRSQIPPGSSEPLLDNGIIQFTAGVARYELSYLLTLSTPVPRSQAPLANATATQPFGVIRLNHEQRLVLAAFAEGRLSDPLATTMPVPANMSVAHRLGWSARKLDRKLDYLCRRLSESGVPGLRGGKGSEAVDRRIRLIEHVLGAGLIDDRDLAALQEHTSDTPSTS